MPYRICRHILTTGLQCQSPAMLQQDFCYFHTNFRRRSRTAPAPTTGELIAPTYDAKGRFTGMQALPQDVPHTAQPLDLGLLEDSTSVQAAISTVVHAIATNGIDMRRATALLYGLQLASLNCRRLPVAPAEPLDVLRDTVPDTHGDPIACAGLRDTDQWDYPEDEEDTLETIPNPNEMTNLPTSPIE